MKPKTNLNDILRDKVFYQWQEVYQRDLPELLNPVTELRFSEEMPNTIIIGSDLHFLITNGLSNLCENVNHHAKESDKRRITTTLKRDKQIIELEWNGDPLTPNEELRINRKYWEGAHLKERPKFNGTKIAGYTFARLNGYVKIEALDSGIYVARNTIELPIGLPIDIKITGEGK